MSTLFNTIVDEVYTITNRRNLVKETQLAVKSATLQLHRAEYFYKDIQETALQFSENAFLQTIEYRELFPRFRALKYLRKYDLTNGVGDFLKVVTPDNVLDKDNLQQVDICYLAGEVIQVKSGTALSYGLIGFYQNPDVNPDTYKSWIADEALYAIVYKAASIIFGTVLGDTARMQANNTQAQLEMTEIINANILAEGY